MRMNLNIMIKYSNWKDRMKIQVLKKYWMKGVIAAKLYIKTIRMQSIVIFVH